MTDDRPGPGLLANGAVAVISVALGLFLGGAVFAGVVRTGGGFATSLVAAIVVALLATAGMVAWSLFVWSEARKKAVWHGVWRSTLTGSAPSDADPVQWLPRLRSRRKLWKAMVIAEPIMFGLFSALDLYLVLSDPAGWWPWVGVVFFGAAAVLGVFTSRLQVKRIDRVIIELEQRPDAMVTSPRGHDA